MSTTLRISEAASIALHSMSYLAANRERLITSREIIGALKVSDAHLMKVLQRLVKAGLVKSIRGPNGGFLLTRPADKITLLDVYESIEGKPDFNNCLLGTPVCRDKKCILGGLIGNVNNEVLNYFSKTNLAQLSEAFR
jgi:Rrf2 family protein